MSNLSLKKLSIAVVVASLASNLAFANNEIKTVIPKVDKPTPSFSQLVANYDVDKSNTLSVAELSDNDTITSIFAKIDINQDKQISEREFNDYSSRF